MNGHFNINLKNLDIDFCDTCLKEQTKLVFEPLYFRFNVFRASILYSKQNKLNYKLAFFEKFEKVHPSPTQGNSF